MSATQCRSMHYQTLKNWCIFIPHQLIRNLDHQVHYKFSFNSIPLLSNLNRFQNKGHSSKRNGRNEGKRHTLGQTRFYRDFIYFEKSWCIDRDSSKVFLKGNNYHISLLHST